MRMIVMNERHNPTEKALAFIFIVGDAWARISISLYHRISKNSISQQQVLRPIFGMPIRDCGCIISYTLIQV
jgi:hypothetical protein